MCPHCKKQNGIRIRETLRDRTDCFKIPKLVSFTVDRRKFSSPEEAYDYVMEKHLFARLLTKELGIRIWLGVLEPQELTGDGWPHWHFLLDLSEMPDVWKNRNTGEMSREKPADARGWVLLKNYVDYGRVNRLLQKWRLGSCKFSTSKKKYESPAHAINYITKYLWKQPKLGYPPWMQKRSRLRMIYKSNDLNAALRGAEVVQDEPGQEQEEEKQEKKPRAKSRNPYQRIAECGYRAQIMNATLGGVFGRPLYVCPSWLRDQLDERLERTDKKTGKVYTVPGCTGFDNALAFRNYALDQQRKKHVKDLIALREELLLIQWDNLRKLYAGEYETADARVLILQQA
jgi:hypothetical protein